MLKSAKCYGKREKGFTLVELVIVIGMISLLAAMSVPSMTGVTNRAKDVKLGCDLQTLDTVLMVYYSEHDCYPNAITDLAPKYIKSIPKDTNKADLSYSVSDDKSTYSLSGNNTQAVSVVSPGSNS